MQLKSQYKQWLASSDALEVAINSHLRNGKLSNAIVADLAAAHAEHYKAVLVQRDDGRYKFFTDAEATSEFRHDAAQRKWERGVQRFQRVQLTERGGARKADPLAAVQREFDKLSKAMQKKFLAQYQ
jgi:protein subunit release factor A